MELFAPGRLRSSLVHRLPAFDRSRCECGAYLVGIVGRPQSGGQCAGAGPGGLHVVEVTKPSSRLIVRRSQFPGREPTHTGTPRTEGMPVNDERRTTNGEPRTEK